MKEIAVVKGSQRDRLAYVSVWVAVITPLLLSLWQSRSGGIGGLDHFLALTGLWATRTLVLTLAFTPVVRLTRQRWMMRCRRIVGLATFGYTVLHATIYLLGEHAWRYPAQLVTQPYLAAGTVALLLLIPMAATSSNAVVRRIGGETWKRIHRAIYVIAPLAVLHNMLAGGPRAEAIVEAILVALLLGHRLFVWCTSSRPRWSADEQRRCGVTGATIR